MNYEALDEALEYIEVVEEGANAELWKESSKIRKEFSDAVKQAKGKIKTKDYKGAKKDIEDARKVVNKYVKYIDNFKSDGPVSVFTGYWIACLNSMLRLGLSLVIAIVGSVAGTAAANVISQGDPYKAQALANIITLPATLWADIKGIYFDILDIVNFVDGITKGEDAADILNLYRIQCKTAAKDYDYQLKYLENKLDKLEKAKKID